MQVVYFCVISDEMGLEVSVCHYAEKREEVPPNGKVKKVRQNGFGLIYSPAGHSFS